MISTEYYHNCLLFSTPEDARLASLECKKSGVPTDLRVSALLFYDRASFDYADYHLRMKMDGPRKPRVVPTSSSSNI